VRAMLEKDWGAVMLTNIQLREIQTRAKQFDLIIYDADRTLVRRPDNRSGADPEFLPNVLEVHEHAQTFGLSWLDSGTQFAIATNQGGPACRDAGWPTSKKYPSYGHVVNFYRLVAQRMENNANRGLYIAMAYKTQSGEILVPAHVMSSSRQLDPSWRKPEPGMILAAQRDARWASLMSRRFDGNNTLMVGDSDADRLAAEAAGVHFAWAWDYFFWTDEQREEILK